MNLINWIIGSIFLSGVLTSTTVMGQEEQKVFFDFSNEINTDYRFFFEDGLYENQDRFYASIAWLPEFSLDWDEGEQRLVGDFFGRLSSGDQERTHWDIRQLYYQIAKGRWEANVGLKKIYWGVTEIVHLVDVINQTDLVESFDGEEKLGQPMGQITYLGDFGTFEFFVMPYHRTRLFPSDGGRFRAALPIKNENEIYLSEAGNNHVDLAARWSHSIGIMDLGLSYLYGNNRDPLIVPFVITDINGSAIGVELRQLYEKMHHAGVDLQATSGSTLYKFEGIYRNTDLDNFIAFDAGLEYTLANVNNKGLDIGLLLEYIYDGRGEGAPTGLDNDVFVATRFGFNDINDTAILMGAGIDVEQGSQVFSIEASKRFFNSFTGEIEARIFSSIKEEEAFYGVRKDSFLQLTVAYFF